MRLRVAAAVGANLEQCAMSGGAAVFGRAKKQVAGPHQSRGRLRPAADVGKNLQRRQAGAVGGHAIHHAVAHPAVARSAQPRDPVEHAA